MDIQYKEQAITHGVKQNEISALLPVYGRFARLSITAHHVAMMDDRVSHLHFDCRPLERDDNPPKKIRGASWDGRLFLNDKANNRLLEQRIELPTLFGSICNGNFSDGDEEIGRFVAGGIMRSVESIVETTRRYIRKSLGRSCFGLVSDIISRRYGGRTIDSVNAFLKSVDWGRMFNGSYCGDKALNVVSYTLANNPLNLFNLDADESNSIALIALNQHGVADSLDLPSIKATELLKNVCGDDKLFEFMEHGYITASNHGYKFILTPSKFIRCIDPFGKLADLCIHTVGLSCHPIDEVIAAWLEIKWNMGEFMQTAIYQYEADDFRRFQ
jgi:hypothetical protein